MKKKFTKSLGMAALILFAACKKDAQNKDDAMENNIILAEWTGPYQGVPAFNKMKVEMLKPAIMKGMEQHLKEIDSIAGNAEAPTFENTIIPFEKTGAALDRAFTYYGIFSSNLSSPEFREIQKELSPKISEYSSKISQNEQLFQRIKAVYEQSQEKALDSAEQRTIDLIYKDFEMDGANLSEEDKKRYAEINKELSELYTQFSNNVLADEEGYVTYIDSTQLSGLPESYIKSAASAASERDHQGEFAITNTRSSMDPFLTYSDERELREKVWRTYYSRGNNGDNHDNNQVIKKILELRDERVALLGYDNYAQWRLQDRMAKTPKQAMELMEAVWPAALGRVEEEIKDMQELANKEGKDIKIQAWDYRYYMEKVRKEKYDLDSEEIKQYLQLDNLKKAIFYVAGELFNFDFTPVDTSLVPVFHPDVSVYEVNDKTNGEVVGLWYLDPYARPGKRSGAWATTYRSKDELSGNKPVLASNNSNFVKPAKGEPTLVSWDDAETFFHEFGHALHFLSAKIKYPKLNSGVRDYTEFQSQLLERWLSTDAVIDQFLRHYETGEPMPEALVKKIKKAATFNQGFGTTEFLASALMDMKYHTTDPSKINDVQEFEKQQLDELGLPEEIPMRHRSTQFSHIFSGEGYAAGYYGYLWADVLTADAAEAFAEAPDGFYDKETAHKLVKYLFAPRNAMDPAKAYKKFRGRNANIDALMRDRGFPVPKN
ncbi:M3 family metallopeptidase [Zunongwangia profunda]|jgi:peptidyl-dipeptidase Dcp|uniref:oligopeptidase A n=1 Tax=Zunongwangia profunda (strain DSM 18752 / CCTCC AB 206139 / SM-A87) TaxID=655815 RepID=D5BC13_ZUNPS|nr:M3 family metallopeptidase [Zunongwangia profunda]ADF52612.1 Dcp-like secreted peptidyl-dipeptidase [Zunongwangia profunda SM-A87]MCC4227614.1 M3 family metallopeptidase [Zunongwangia profunda]